MVVSSVQLKIGFVFLYFFFSFNQKIKKKEHKLLKNVC